MATRRGRAHGTATRALLRLLVLVAVLVAGGHGATGPDRTPGAGATSTGSVTAQLRTPQSTADLADGHDDRAAVATVVALRAASGPLLPASLCAPMVVGAQSLLLGQLPRPPDCSRTSSTRTTWQGRAPPRATGT